MKDTNYEDCAFCKRIKESNVRLIPNAYELYKNLLNTGLPILFFKYMTAREDSEAKKIVSDIKRSLR